MKKTFLKTTAAMLVLALVVIFVLASCATAEGKIKFPIVEDEINAGNYAEAYRSLRGEREYYKYSEYKLNNEISYQLDRGFLAHYAGDYTNSNEELLEAERLMEEAYTKSVSQGVKRVSKADPYKIDYAGEDYENIYINVFSALNFYNMGKLEEAQVEIRKMNDKMRFYANEYENMMVALGSADWRSKVSGSPTYYYQSALASYMGMLFWRANGNADSARIDAQGITDAYKIMPEVYRTPIPRELAMRGNVNDELSVSAGMARLNFIAFTGFSPLKGGFGDLVPRRSLVSRIEVVFDNGTRTDLTLLEPISNVVFQVQQTRRFYQNNAERLMSNLGNAKMAGDFAILSLAKVALAPAYVGGTAAFALFNNFAKPNPQNVYDTDYRAYDLRMGRYIPGNAYVGGVTLPPGKYSFTINYYNGSKIIDSRKITNRTITAGGLNLVEDFNTAHEYVRRPEGLAPEGDMAKYYYRYYNEGEKGRTPLTMQNILSGGTHGAIDPGSFDPMPDFAGRLAAPNIQTRTSNGELYLRWDPVPGALYYAVYRRSETYDASTLTDPVLITGTNYKVWESEAPWLYRVIAYGVDGWGYPSKMYRWPGTN